MPNARLTTVVVVACLVPWSAVVLYAQTTHVKKYPRVRPPEFHPSEASGVFFDDVFRDAVQGNRPITAGFPPGPNAGGSPTPIPESKTSTDSTGRSGTGWSRWIDASSLEDEIKSIKLKVDQDVTTPTQFRSRDFKSCRRCFTMLAMLFGIIEEYDGDVRWKDSSPALRQAFARAAVNCKTGSDQAYNEAKLRKLDLEDAVGGGSVNLPEGKPRVNWEGVCDRSPLMQRLEIILQEQLRPKTANPGDFQANLDALHRDAQLIAAMGRVLRQEGMTDAGDEDYDKFCDTLSEAAGALAEAVKTSSYERATSAVSRISQSCSSCHDLYR